MVWWWRRGDGGDLNAVLLPVVGNVNAGQRGAYLSHITTCIPILVEDDFRLATYLLNSGTHALHLVVNLWSQTTASAHAVATVLSPDRMETCVVTAVTQPRMAVMGLGALSRE